MLREKSPLSWGMAGVRRIVNVPTGRSYIGWQALQICVFLAGCHSTYTRPAAMGSESIGAEANARLANTATKSAYLAAISASTVAVHSPGNPRALAKATELLKGWMVLNQQDTPARRSILNDVPALVKVAETGRWSCELRPALAELFDATQQGRQAGELLLRAARQCASVSAALAAVSYLKSAGRCDDANAALRAVWPRARPQEKAAILDAVAACTEPLFLEQTLAFAGAPVVRRYLEALERKRQTAELRKQREEEREEAERPQREAEEEDARAKNSERQQAKSDLWEDKNICLDQCRQDFPDFGDGRSRCESRCEDQETLQRRRLDR